jgi:hypothetical protein
MIDGPIIINLVKIYLVISEYINSINVNYKFNS